MFREIMMEGRRNGVDGWLSANAIGAASTITLSYRYNRTREPSILSVADSLGMHERHHLEPGRAYRRSDELLPLKGIAKHASTTVLPVDRTKSAVIVGVEPNLVYRRVMVNVPSIEQLTENQRVCLRMVLTRHSSKEIAIELGISESAVNKRLERAVQQLGASSRFAAARMLAAADRERPEHHGAYNALAAYVEDAPGSPVAPDRVGVVQRLLGIGSPEDGSRPRNTLGWSGRLAAIAALMLLVAMAFVALLSMGQTLTSMVAERTVVRR